MSFSLHWSLKISKLFIFGSKISTYQEKKKGGGGLVGDCISAQKQKKKTKTQTKRGSVRGKNEKKWVILALGLQCDGQIEKRERAREKEE